MAGNYIAAADAFDRWRDDLLTGKPPTFYRIADYGPLSRIELGPGLITLIGGAPGAGKTAFIMQGVCDALRLNESLRAVVCNIEMPPSVLLDRQLSRLSGVPLRFIRYRRFEPEHIERIDAAFEVIESIVDRLCFVKPPYDLANVAATADDFAPVVEHKPLLVLDYIQRISPPGDRADNRQSINATMDYLRQFADAGAAVIAVSSVGRQKDAKGRSSYAAESMNLASFKESGELEFGADDAFILTAGKRRDERKLLHLKARHTEAVDILLAFDGSVQAFSTADAASESVADDDQADRNRWAAELSGLWDGSEAEA